MPELPVVVIGAGPQGLAAAAHLTERGLDAVVVERGAGAGAAISGWGHVRLFSAWSELTDAAARRLLEPTGWVAPASGYPTGAEWVGAYLAPLAEALGERVLYGRTVTGIARQGRDKVVESGRKSQPFVVHTQEQDGRDGRILARSVIDASGTWGLPNPAGADGFPAIGEAAAAERISYRIPDDVSELAGSHVVVVGAGHSATHAVLRLSELARRGCCAASRRTSSVPAMATNFPSALHSEPGRARSSRPALSTSSPGSGLPSSAEAGNL